MNIQKGDYNGLVNELQTTRGKDFSVTQVETLITEFKTIQWGASCWIVKSIIRSANLPNNLYGLLLDKIDNQKYEETKQLERKKSWKADENCLSPEEFNTGMLCLAKISQMNNSCERLKKFGASCEVAIDGGKLLEFLKSSLILADQYSQANFEKKKESVLAQLAG
jgi:hypothetical protein